MANHLLLLGFVCYNLDIITQNMIKQPLPTEYEEQCALVEYLELKGLLFSKTAQETFTRSWAQKAKNKRSGLRKGLPDMFIFIPAEKSSNGSSMLLAIEMKRLKGGRLSPEQKLWIESFRRVDGIFPAVCNGFEEARQFIEESLAK